MLGLYADYSRHEVGHICAVWQHTYLGAYANNMKCISVLLVTLLIAVSLGKTCVMT